MKIMRTGLDHTDLIVHNSLMKAVFSLFIIFHSVFLYSQSLTISYKGIDVSNKEILAEGSSSDNEIIAYLKINNTSAEQVLVKVRKIEISVINGSQNSFCFGVCYAPSVYESIFPHTISAGGNTKDSIFSVTYCPCGIAGQTVIRYEVFDVNDPENKKVSVTVNFTGSPPSGIDKNSTARETFIIYPNPCYHDQLTISFNRSGTLNFNRMILTTSSGIVLNSFTEIDHSDSFLVDVNNYPDGIYFLFLIGDKGAKRTEKIIIKR